MSLANRVNLILRKLDDPDCVQIAEKEIKSLIVEEIDNGEKLNILINAIAEEKNYSTKKTQYSALKLFIMLAEIFQHQILEFLPKVFAILNKKINGSDENVHEVIAETYAGVIEFSFKGADSADANFVLTECLQQIFELYENKMKNVHICAGLCICKMLQSCEINMVEQNFEEIYKNLTIVLKVAKEKYTVIEAILTLILSVSSKVAIIGDDVIETLLNYIGDPNHKTRKVCIDLLYAILSMNRDILDAYNDQMYKVMQEMKTDKNKFVREAAMECINILVAPGKVVYEEQPLKAKLTGTNNPPKNATNKFVRKSSGKIVNKKINLEHVTATIDKTKFNKTFAGNANSFDMPVVLVKEPKNIEEYQRIQQITEANLIKFKNEQEAEGKKTLRKVSDDERHSQEKKHKRDDSHNDGHHNFMHVEPNMERNESGDNEPNNQKDIDTRKQTGGEPSDFIDRKEAENMRKYIKILNGKVKELSMTCNHLTKINNDLAGKVTALEQNYSYLHNMMQRNNFRTQEGSFNESYVHQNNNHNFATPDKFMQTMPQNPSLTMSQSLRHAIPNENNKWLSKTTNVNTKLFNILAVNNDDMFFNFLRDSANYNNFRSIDNYLIEQLHSRLVDLLTRTANDNSLVAEYTLRWIHLFIDAGLPSNERDAKKLQSLLFYLSKNVEDTFLADKVKQMLDHEYFSHNGEDFGNYTTTRRPKEEA